MASIASRLQAIRDDFLTAASKLDAILTHIDLDGPADPALRVTMNNNMIVALSAAIEETIRNLFSEYLSIVEEAYRDHRRLRPSLQKSNVDCLIDELRKLRKPTDVRKAAAIASNLERCLTGNDAYHLLREKITYNTGNFKTEEITSIAKRSGIAEILKSICDCAEVQEWTGRDDIDGRISALVAEWNEIFLERDLVVHKISSATGWGSPRIKRAIDLAKLIIKRISVSLDFDADILIVSSSSWPLRPLLPPEIEID